MKSRNAPPLSIRCGRHRVTLASFERQPVVLAFLERWSADVDLEAMRAELRGLGAVLVVLSPEGLFSFRADDDLELVAGPGDLDVDDVIRAHRDWGIKPCAPSALFLVDGDGVVRFERIFAGLTQRALQRALEEAGASFVASRGVAVSRRELVMTSLVAGFVLALVPGCRAKDVPPPLAADAGGPPAGIPELDIQLHVNGEQKAVKVDPRSTLLDTLRERMGLTGSKKGCDHGQCGACTVLMDGRRVNSCLVFAVMAEGAKIQTIEGLAKDDALHPMQSAFIVEDGLQCGYCTPGQIMSALGLVLEKRATTDIEVREQMSGNICRCGAYTNIVAAIQRARKEMV